MQVDLRVKYEAGHSLSESWEPTEHHCPGCGTKDVWHDMSGGDYYVGERFLCRACGASFTMQYVGPSQNNEDQQRLQAIRGASNGEHRG